MQNINSAKELKKEIQLLEIEQTFKMQQLKEQFYITSDSFKPFNMLKSTIKDAISYPNIIDNILSTTIGLATGYISKKIVVGKSNNIFRNIIGSVLQFGVTKTVAQQPLAIKSVGQYIFHKIFDKKKIKSKKP